MQFDYVRYMQKPGIDLNQFSSGGPLDRESEDALKLEAIRRAGQLGLADIVLDRFQDVNPALLMLRWKDLALKPESDPSRLLEAPTETNGKQPDPDRHRYDRTVAFER